MSRKSTAQHNQTPPISYHDALRLKIDGKTSVASASIADFRDWCRPGGYCEMGRHQQGLSLSDSWG